MEPQNRLSNNSIDGNNIGYILEKPKKSQFYHQSTPMIKKQKLNYDINSEKKDNSNKHSLFLKKINLKENKNKYYKECVYKLFNDENVFLENLYKGKKIIIGKSRNKSNISNHHHIRLKTRRFTKKALIKSLNSINNTKTNVVNDSANQSNKGRKTIFVGKKNDKFITDDELKKIYQECIIRENENNLQLSTIKSKYSKNKSFINGDNINISSENEVNNILNLQSTVLNNFKLWNMEENKMIDRLLKNTSKKKEKLLMNQINDYRLKKEKIEEMDKNKIISSNPNYKNFKEVNKKLQWCTSLRDYHNKLEVNNEKNRMLSSNSKQGFLSPNKNFYSFDKRDVVFDLSGHIKPLFAQITPKTYKENEKIRDTLNDLKIQKKAGIENNIDYPITNRNSIKRQKSFFNNKGIKGNLFKGLNIRGKKLINFEIELSKDLEGKKKRIVHFPYKEEEITNKIFAKSYSVNNFYIPKSLKNTVELHYEKKSL
jgi:hypothetical protein